MDSPNSATEKDADAGAKCFLYVSGFFDAMSIFDGNVCTTQQRPSVGTVARLYVDYMRRNPKMMDSDEARGLAFAITEAYPCKSQ